MERVGARGRDRRNGRNCLRGAGKRILEKESDIKGNSTGN